MTSKNINDVHTNFIKKFLENSEKNLKLFQKTLARCFSFQYWNCLVGDDGDGEDKI